MFNNYQVETISSQAPHKKVKVQRLVYRHVHPSGWKRGGSQKKKKFKEKTKYNNSLIL